MAAGGLMIVVGLIITVRARYRKASETLTPSTDGGTGTTDQVVVAPMDGSTVDDTSVKDTKPESAETESEAEESGESAEQALPESSGDDESESDNKAPDRRIIGLIGAAANVCTQAESALDDGDYDVAEKRLQSAQSTLDTAIEVDDTHNLGRTDDLQARRESVEELLKDVERQRDGVSNADKRVIGMLGSAASSVSYAKTAIDEGDYDLAVTRLQSALSTYQMASDVNETHTLGRGDDIQHRASEVKDLLAKVERHRDEASTTGEEVPDDAGGGTNDGRELTDVSGVLSEDATALRAAGFESVADLEHASTADLQAVEGIDPHVALRIKADVGG